MTGKITSHAASTGTLRHHNAYLQPDPLKHEISELVVDTAILEGGSTQNLAHENFHGWFRIVHDIRYKNKVS